MTRISIIVATDDRGGIGLEGDLPWRLPEDLKRFKALTMGKPIVMGRKTYDSIGRPLPGRQNIVITRQPGLVAPGCTVVGSLADALAAAGNAPEVCVIGGAEIYRLALPLAQVIHLTRVHDRVDADTFFPVIDGEQWSVLSRTEHPPDPRHASGYSFVTLERKRAPTEDAHR